MHRGRKALKKISKDTLKCETAGSSTRPQSHVLSEQEMHRKCLENDSQLCKEICNVDGTTFKGLFEILQERGGNCIAVDHKPMIKTCSKKRRRALHFTTDMACDAHVRCCLENTLRSSMAAGFYRSKVQSGGSLRKCKVCVGVKFQMLMILSP
jgi:hypothetical protein